MAKSKSKASPQATEASKFSRKDITSIWEALTVADWLKLPQSASLSFTKYKGDSIRGLCPHPDHSDTNPSFHIRPKQHHAYCFGCGYRTIDPIELIAHITGMTYPQAIVYVANAYPGAEHLKDNTLVAKSQLIHMTQLAKKIFYDICHDQLVAAAKAYAEELVIKSNPRNKVSFEDEDASDCDYSVLGEEPDYPDEFAPNPDVEDDVPDNVTPITGGKSTEFDYAIKTIHWLVVTRKIPLELLEKLPIGIIPPINAIPKLAHKKIGADKTYAEYNAIELIQFIKNFLSSEINNSATTAGVSSVVFPLCTTENHIAAFRIRLPNDPGDSKRLGLIQDALDTSAGFFGLNFAPYVTFQKEGDDAKPKSYTVVEGEFDALQPMIRVLQTGKVEQAVISAGGTSALIAFDEIIQTNDIQQLFLMGDAPTKGNKNTSENVVTQWINQVTVQDCSLSVFANDAWATLNPAEDLDHAYTASGIAADIIDAALYDKQNYVQAWRWMVNRVVTVLAEYDEDAVSILTATAADYGKNLHRKNDIEIYAQKINELYPVIRIKPLINEILSSDESIDGFVQRIARTFLDIYSTISIKEGSFNEKYLQLFHREDRRFTSIKIDCAQSIAQEVALIAGGIQPFINNEVGAPPMYRNPKEGRRTIDRELRDLIRDALSTLAVGVKHDANLTKVRNGYHYLPNKELVVHGIDTYVLNRQDSQFTITKTAEPRIDDTVIDIYTEDSAHKQPWYNSETLTEKVIIESQDYDMRQTYTDLCRLFNAGFGFEHQRSTSKFLAALILTFPIMSCLDRKVLIHFTGETSSGKSRLMSVFSPVTTDPTDPYNIQILFASRYFFKITPPAFSRTASGASILHCIDELEFDTPKNVQNSGQIMEALRGMQLGSGGKRTISNMGTNGTTTFEYDVPVIFASITGTDRPQDMNRILQVKMKKEIGRSDPNTTIRSMFSPEDILRLRRSTNFGLYSQVPTIREKYLKYKGSFETIKKRFSFNVEQRFISALYPLLSVLETIGVDPYSFLDDYVNANADHIVRDDGTSDADTYLTKIFQYNVIRLKDYKETGTCYTLARVLANRVQRFELNDSGVGVFYDEKDNLLLFNLEQVIAHLIPPQARAQSAMSAIQLRTILERHPAALNIDQTLSSGVLNRAKVHLGVGLQMRGVAVFRAKYWLNEDLKEDTVLAKTVPPADLETKDQVNAPDDIEEEWYS
jgi:hypothetical protein